MSKSRTWAFTIPFASTLPQWGDETNYYRYQQEIGGTTEYHHYQGLVQFKARRMLPAMKKLHETAHWEVVHDIRAMDHYCSKPIDKCECKHCLGLGLRIEGTDNVCWGELDLQGKRNDVRFLKRILDEGANEERIMEEMPDAFDKYPRLLERHDRLNARKKARMLFTFDCNKFPWQGDLIEILQQPSHPRTIHWYWEPKGNKGKSYLAKYLRINLNAFTINGGKHADIYHAYNYEPIVVMDLARTAEDSVPYAVIENIKNGVFLSTKYSSVIKEFPSPHVVILANYSPEESKISIDRWHIVRV